MKDSLIFGVMVGLVAGALLFKHCETAQDVINKGEKAVKKEIKDMKKRISPKPNKS